MLESASPTRLVTTPNASLAPHPPIASAYSAPAQKRPFLNAIFDDTAQDYDRIEKWVSLGTGRLYRRQALLRAGLKPGMAVADVAVGTGLVAVEAQAIIGAGGRLVGVDPSPNMMRCAREHFGIETVLGSAESLPFDDATFDFLSMGYALRHVEDLNAAFREFHRVLKPGGRLCILEITRPKTSLGRNFFRAYLWSVSRLAGMRFRLAPRTPELWSYYWKTIDACAPAQSIMDALAGAGFNSIHRNVVGGVFSEYTATR